MTAPFVLAVPSKGRLQENAEAFFSRAGLALAKPGGARDYPLCDAAQYFRADALGQPGQGRATYLYAHARTGMFLPLLTASKV